VIPRDEIVNPLHNSHNGQLYEKALRAKQGHIFYWWNDIAEEERLTLLDQISHINFDLLDGVTQNILSAEKEDFSNLAPAQSTALDGEILLKVKKIGEQAIRNGKVCSLVLAGGQGTRLGFGHPKGMFPIGPVSGKSLFQWFAEKILFMSKKVEATRQIPWLIMTSDTTDAETKSFFQKKGFFGLGKEDVDFFKQGFLPAIDCQGKLLLDSKYHICENPDGHGGIIKALGESGLLEKISQQGIEHIFLHNVDNCLTKICDPVFLGYHIDTDADFSCKSLTKQSADETLATIVDANGKIKIIEYSDTPEEIANLRNQKNGQLVFNNGSINTFFIRVDFLKSHYQEMCELPVHCVKKNIRVLDTSGYLPDSRVICGIKLETKIFDICQYTQKVTLVMANRNEEFSPLKNKDGLESYSTVFEDLQTLFLGWMKCAGITFSAGLIKKIEISPLFAVDQDTFLERVALIGQAAFKKRLETQIEENGWISL
jgi:UDP-N-acetylglucosamine/UDP-N-acetylgalactosamine diphosphorylase